jgi:hypothetical protein
MLTSAASLRSVRMSQIPWGDKHSSYGGLRSIGERKKRRGLAATSAWLDLHHRPLCVHVDVLQLHIEGVG